MLSRVVLDRGLAEYRRGAYFEAHDTWEAPWQRMPDGPERQALQGLIQIAAAMYKHFDQHKPEPAARLLERAVLHLRRGPVDLVGLPIAPIIAAAVAARTELLATGGLAAAPVLAAPTLS